MNNLKPSRSLSSARAEASKQEWGREGDTLRQAQCQRDEGRGSFKLRPFGKSRTRERGVAAVEFVLILPIMLVMVFGVVDLGRLIQARLVIGNVSREGGSLASRGFNSEVMLLGMLQASGTPLDLSGSGRIYVTSIRAGTPSDELPSIDTDLSTGNLGVSSSIRADLPTLGLSEALYDRLRFDEAQKTSDIKELWVVQVYYKYVPVTPLPSFIKDTFITPGYDGRIIGSKAVF